MLEKNVYLQQEIENKMELVISIQRIKDELKGINLHLKQIHTDTYTYMYYKWIIIY